jgi:hypothetical protein
VLVVILSVTALVGTMVSAGIQRAFAARRLSDRTRAQAIAEAGANKAYSVLAANFDQRTNAAAFPAESYGGGRFVLNVTPVGTGTAVINSTGQFNNVSESVILDVTRDGVGSPGWSGDEDPYKHTIVANGKVTWTGVGQFVGPGTVYANSDFKQAGSGELNADCFSFTDFVLNGASGLIDGDVYAPDVDGKTNKVTGTVYEQSVPRVGMPEIDLTPYYNHAKANGQVRTGSLTISGSYTPAGGVFWVEGNLTLTGNGTLTGCFIATGDIKAAGGTTQVKVGDLPALVSRDGDITIGGGGIYEGLIFARIGDINVVGGCEVTGSLICGGNFIKHGESSIFASQPYKPVPPGGDPVIAEHTASVWQK